MVIGRLLEAMAQISSFTKHTASYRWSIMSSNTLAIDNATVYNTQLCHAYQICHVKARKKTPIQQT